MNETEIGKKPFDKKGIVLGAGFVFILCAGILGGYLMKSSEPTRDCVTESVKTETTKTEVATNTTAEKETDIANITYKTFSSPDANFTFEYPSDWTYKEGKDTNVLPNLSTWAFYKGEANDSSDNNNMVLGVGPMTDAMDFFSGAESLGSHGPDKVPYFVRTYPTNDPETFITQEQDEWDGQVGGYIYWQKGKYFANADAIGRDYSGKIYVMSYSHSLVPGPMETTKNDAKIADEIAQHIAESIKVK